MYQAKAILKEAGAKTFAKEYETGHGLTEETVSDIRKWMDSVISL
jgi:predicted esterase